MSENTLIVSNWKMNLSLDNAKNLIDKLKKINLKRRSKIQNIICPQFLLIPYVSKLISSSSIILGGQDCHYKNYGSFTGDSSIELLKYYNCKYVILGHSERRIHHGETNLNVKKKCEISIKNKITPIICIGESKKLRKNGKYLDFIINQLDECINKNQKNIIVAYEPIWSIGSGIVPSFDEILEVRMESTKFLNQVKKIKDVRFLYGGSVDSSNFNSIIKKTGVNGALIGSSSINSEEITKIITNVDFN
ncbi:MAG: triose-phosphate isomerase [Rickettsiales bacterium]|nr:triose-phosphate isomerase [Rickettsiales bacterium]|tara:strand:+ start:82 stop:828 length:747 start_codon:yes stop_codon:yes gene_type:complete